MTWIPFEFLFRTDDENSNEAKAPKPKTGRVKQQAVYTEATKQLLISFAPPVLTLHLKRFQQVGFGLRKMAKHVTFPLQLDLAPFCSRRGEVRGVRVCNELSRVKGQGLASEVTRVKFCVVK